MEEIEAQVRSYDLLDFWQSARGVSMLLLFAAALAISALILAHVWPATGYVDVGALGILAVLVYGGYGWAILATMMFWTAANAAAVAWPATALNPLVAMLWWAVTMRALWLAWRIEKARAATSAP